MPEKKKKITVPGSDETTLQLLSFGALKKLNWHIKYAADKTLVSFTPRSWSKWDDMVSIEMDDNQLVITSKLIHGELWDILNKNQKHIDQFLSAFGKVKANSSPEEIAEWRKELDDLKLFSVQAAEKEAGEAIEVDKVMNFSTGNLHFTYCIIGINVLFFLLLMASTRGFYSPSSMQVLKWGGNLPALTFGGDWWRLISSMFLHFGFMHLAVNMMALLFAGAYLEPMLGKTRYTIAYFCSGALASLTSIIWHRHEMVVSAGASGAVFGMFGVFLSLLITNVIPRQIRGSLLVSILVFMGYNIFSGFRLNSNIDNAAHLGGLFAGMVIGLVYSLGFKRFAENKAKRIAAVLAMVVAIIIIVVLSMERTPAVQVDYARGRIYTPEEKKKEEEGKNAEKFASTLEHFSILEELAIEAMQVPDTMSREEALENLRKTALVDWAECINLMEQHDKLELSAQLDTLRIVLIRYSNQRLQETLLLIKAREEETNRYNTSIDSIRGIIRELILQTKKISKPQAID